MSTRSDLAAVVADYKLRGTAHVPILALEKVLAKPERDRTTLVLALTLIGVGVVLGIAAFVVAVVGP